MIKSSLVWSCIYKGTCGQISTNQIHLFNVEIFSGEPLKRLLNTCSSDKAIKALELLI